MWTSDRLSKRELKKILFYVLCLIIIALVTKGLSLISRDKGAIRAIELSRLVPEVQMKLKYIHNFHRFPCYPHLWPSVDLKWHGRCVRTVNKAAFDLGVTLDERCQFLPIRSKPSICTYKPMKENELLFFNEEGRKNKKYIENMLKVLEANPRMFFFDVGESDGSYCMAAAEYRNQTVCMNGNFKTLHVLVKSLVINSMVDNASLIWNVLLDKHRTLTYRLYDTPKIPTTTSSEFDTFSTLHSNDPKVEYQVNSVTLNDLTGIFNDKTVFMKLDMEFHNVSILRSADRFFSKVDVKFLQVVNSQQPKAKRLGKLLEYYGYLPYRDIFNKSYLSLSSNWPQNVYFIR